MLFFFFKQKINNCAGVTERRHQNVGNERCYLKVANILKEPHQIPT